MIHMFEGKDQINEMKTMVVKLKTEFALRRDLHLLRRPKGQQFIFLNVASFFKVHPSGIFLQEEVFSLRESSQRSAYRLFLETKPFPKRVQFHGHFLSARHTILF